VSSWRPRIITLLARHGTAKYADALHEIRTLYQRQMPEAAHDVLVIDNALALDHEERIELGVTLIGGSNTAWEFSAWDSGLAYLSHHLDEYDLVNLATSAFRQLYARYLDRFDLDMLGLLRRRAAAIGHIDYYGAPVSLLRIGSQAWLRSSFIIVPANELRLLKTLVSVTDTSCFFSGDPASPFRANAPISAAYRNNILSWLTGEGTGQGVTWHTRFDLNAETLSFFESKTLAILNEQMLSNRLRRQGCALVDATWLATCAWLHDGASIGVIPNWRQQVTARDEAAAPMSLLNV
jgi:hypothetical protein